MANKRVQAAKLLIFAAITFSLLSTGIANAPASDARAIPDTSVPDWIADGIIYQIFPDRFYDGDQSNNIKTGQYTYAGNKTLQRSWGESPITEKGISPAFTFYGGDLDGIREKLNYVRDTLGANVIYLNPVFESPSNHKYDTTDYDNTAECLGGNEALSKLSKAIHNSPNPGFLILDAVYNHTGDGHYWFGKYSFTPNSKSNDASNAGKTKETQEGAYQSKSSPYFTYYSFKTWPNKYATFLDVDSLPKLNFASEKVKDLIYRNPDSVAKKYLKEPLKIDGWRIDAPQYVDENGKQGFDKFNHSIWQDFRQEIKQVNPKALILGEFWHDASAWTNSGKEWDTVTNFMGFTEPVSEWICGVNYDGKPSKLTATAFDKKLLKTRSIYPASVQRILSNHLSNHDISRFAERADGDLRKSALAFLFQMTYVGVPTIYYGDEYGMRGGKDPDCRRTFDWNKLNEKDSGALIEHVHKLIELRKKYSALRSASFITLGTNDLKNTYSYGRHDDKTKIAVILNGSEKSQDVDLDLQKLGLKEQEPLLDELSGIKYSLKNGRVSLTLAPYSGSILVQNVEDASKK